VVSRHVASQHFLRKLDERANDVELLAWTHRHARGKYGKLTAENLCEQDAHRVDDPVLRLSKTYAVSLSLRLPDYTALVYASTLQHRHGLRQIRQEACCAHMLSASLHVALA
jgi:hypothetical protein